MGKERVFLLPSPEIKERTEFKPLCAPASVPVVASLFPPPPSFRAWGFTTQ